MSHHFAQPSTAPGLSPPTAATTSQEAAPPAKDAGGGGGAGSFLNGPMLLVIALPMLLILFMSRNQNKKQKQLEESLKVGDKVVTQSGMLGKINEMDERLVKLEIAPGVKVEVLKSTVQGKYAPVEPKADKDKADKDKADAKDAKDDKPQERKA